MELSAASAPLDVQGLCVDRGAQRVLDGIDLRIAHGEIVALLGANGVGKTTLAHCVAGLLRPHAGRVSIAGVRVDVANPGSRKLLGMAVDHWLLPSELSGHECLRLFAIAQGRPEDARNAAPMLLALGLGDDQMAQALCSWSLGMRQKLGLALGLLGSPRLIVLDETLGGLDAASLLAAAALLREHCAQGTGVLWVTHEIERAARLADRLVLLHGGRIVGSWTRAALARLAEQGRDVLQVLVDATGAAYCAQ